MRILTAGESHSEAVVGVIEGLPKGFRVEPEKIDEALRRRQQGAGRGERMKIETDRVRFISGLRNKVTLGSPICLYVKNKDQTIYPDRKDDLPVITVPRPAHADLAGLLKYKGKDVRDILERASARETVARVALGNVCSQFLENFKISILGFVAGVGHVVSNYNPVSAKDIVSGRKKSKVSCVDPGIESKILSLIKRTEEKGDTLGGIVEIRAYGVPPGLGTFMHFDNRLEAKIAAAIMSIPAVKGVEIGAGFAYAESSGLKAHDEIRFSGKKGFYRDTNNAGGIEGGISNGQPIVVRLAMKPIATTRTPLGSVDFLTMKKQKSSVIRSDVCAITSCVVIAESMLALVLTECFLDKFGCDSLTEISSNYLNYLKSLRKNKATSRH